MFKKACDNFESRRKPADDWKTFMNELNKGNVVITPWCKDTECEKKVKKDSGE